MCNGERTETSVPRSPVVVPWVLFTFMPSHFAHRSLISFYLFLLKCLFNFINLCHSKKNDQTYKHSSNGNLNRWPNAVHCTLNIYKHLYLYSCNNILNHLYRMVWYLISDAVAAAYVFVWTFYLRNGYHEQHPHGDRLYAFWNILYFCSVSCVRMCFFFFWWLLLVCSFKHDNFLIIGLCDSVGLL